MSETEHVEGRNGRSKSANGESKGKFKFDGTMRREEAVAYFEAIVAGLREGTIHFKHGERALSVHPAAKLEVSVKASKKGKEQTVSFDIAWRPEHENGLEITP